MAAAVGATTATATVTGVGEGVGAATAVGASVTAPSGVDAAAAVAATVATGSPAGPGSPASSPTQEATSAAMARTSTAISERNRECPPIRVSPQREIDPAKPSPRRLPAAESTTTPREGSTHHPTLTPPRCPHPPPSATFLPCNTTPTPPPTPPPQSQSPFLSLPTPPRPCHGPARTATTWGCYSWGKIIGIVATLCHTPYESITKTASPQLRRPVKQPLTAITISFVANAFRGQNVVRIGQRQGGLVSHICKNTSPHSYGGAKNESPGALGYNVGSKGP